ncbi:hypothetical protein BpHYR1_003839 [Brachionus plicatilis]|uniref:Uncharacterized protein n=1 Tax=Brachionus plicatilis TaxID=10195 RepID=A0A3M7RT47_BRAPC|nr:hypothetical protein BpHYR1_003839 [Brachionus plicatilis]
MKKFRLDLDKFLFDVVPILFEIAINQINNLFIHLGRLLGDLTLPFQQIKRYTKIIYLNYNIN